MLLLLPLLLNSVGVLATELVTRIVGGHTVSITKRPFQVAIYFKTPNGPVPDCGGAIISNRWILTAAHCVYGIPPKYVFVRAGTDNLKDDKNSVWYRVAVVIIHEQFKLSSDVTNSDIALVMTKTEMKFASNIQPVSVRLESPEPNTEAIISGFGVTAQGSSNMSNTLEEVSVTVLDRGDCIDLLSKISVTIMSLSDTQFCAAYLKGGRDACQGDSGSPVTIDGALAGIVSWGIGCAKKRVPAFYTDVSQFVSWIDENLKKKILHAV